MKDGLTISWSYCTANARVSFFFFSFWDFYANKIPLCAAFKAFCAGNQGNDQYQLLAMALAEFIFYFYYRSKSNIICRLTSAFYSFTIIIPLIFHFFSLYTLLLPHVSEACCYLTEAHHLIKPYIHSYISTDLSLPRKFIAHSFGPRTSERSLASNITPHVDRPNPSRETRSHSRARQSICRGREQETNEYPARCTFCRCPPYLPNHYTTPDSPSPHGAQVPSSPMDTIGASYSKPIKSRHHSVPPGCVRRRLVKCAVCGFLAKVRNLFTFFYDMPRAQRGATHPAGVARACMRDISYHPDLSA